LMNLREGDRLAAIALLEPSPNGNGDDNGHTVVAEGDEELLAVLPSAAAVAESELEEDDESAEDADDTEAED
jgi:hypothetical protein